MFLISNKGRILKYYTKKLEKKNRNLKFSIRQNILIPTFPTRVGDNAHPNIEGEVKMCNDSENDLGRLTVFSAIIGSWSPCNYT